MPWLYRSSRISLPENAIKCALILVYITTVKNNLYFINTCPWWLVNIAAIKRMRKEKATMPGGIKTQQLIQLKTELRKRQSLQGIFVMSFLEEIVSVILDQGDEDLNKLFSGDYLDDKQYEWHIFCPESKMLSIL